MTPDRRRYPSDRNRIMHLRLTPERERKLEELRRRVAPDHPGLVALTQVVNAAIDEAYDRMNAITQS